MSAPGVIGLVLVVLAAAVVAMLVLRRPGRSGAGAAPAGPRTVADLVRLRAESTDPEITSVAGSASGDRLQRNAQPTVPVTAQPSSQPSSRPSPTPRATPSPEGRTARVQPRVGPTPAVAPPPVAPADRGPARPGEPVAPRSAAPAAGSVGPAQPRPTDQPPAPVPAEPAPPAPAEPVSSHAESTEPESTEPEPRAPGPDVTGVDTPWHRAAVMAAGDGGAGTWEPPPPVAPVPVVATPVPLRLVPPVDAAGEPDAASAPGAWTGWADWAEVDAEEAEAEGVRSARRLAEQAGPAVPDPEVAVRGPASSGPETEPTMAAEPPTRTAEPNRVAEATSAREPRSEPPPEPVPDAEPPAAPGTPTVEPPARSSADTEVPLAPHPIPLGTQAAPAPVPPLDPEPEAEPVALPLGRRTPAERAAEQAAADLALLRTFGFGDPSARPDTAPVVSMVRPVAEQKPEAAGGAAQPVRFRVVHRDGATVGGAVVTLLDDRGSAVADATADGAGRGEVLAPAAGTFVLVSTSAGHQPGAVAVTVADGPVEADVLLARSASVSGCVQGEDGPIAAARVTLVQDGEVVEAVNTDAEGHYRIRDIGAGEYGLSVAAAGCVPAAAFVEVPDEADLRHDVVLTSASPRADRYDGDQVGAPGFDAAGDGMMTGKR